jgi:purine-binding chemotaxis protein CheW
MADTATQEVLEEESVATNAEPTEGKSASYMSATLNRDDLMQLVTLILGEEEYGLPIASVQEIIRMRNVKITAIPNAPGFIEGVINLRGRMIPVVDLRTKFGMEQQERGRSNRIVVTNIDERTIGLVVDAVVEVVRVARDELEVLPDLVTGVGADYIKGVTRIDERMIIVLDIDSMFSSTETDSIDEID